MDFSLREIKGEDLNLIENLWVKLNRLHMEDSRFFKEHYATFTFDKRCEKFRGMNSKDVRIEIIESSSMIIGYCISTIQKEIGEIESIFVEQEYRKHGFGNQLVNQAIDWLKRNNCKKIQVSVAEGHESVFEFYMKNGLYPRLTYLELKEL